ncbi:MAG: hypothetical protein R3E08_01645 [Thiotrichaceae bacterium]
MWKLWLPLSFGIPTHAAVFGVLATYQVTRLGIFRVTVATDNVPVYLLYLPWAINLSYASEITGQYYPGTSCIVDGSIGQWF